MNQALREQMLETLTRNRSPEVELGNAQRAVIEAECSLRDIDETLESFDREAMYETGWY